jgi:hypothetical protein
MFTAPWKIHSPQMAGPSPEAARFASVIIDGHRKYLRARDETPPERWLTVRFSDLIGDPSVAVHRIYGYLGLELGSDLAERVRVAGEAARRRRRTHRYTLEQFGLRATDIERALPEVVAETAAAAPASPRQTGPRGS